MSCQKVLILFVIKNFWREVSFLDFILSKIYWLRGAERIWSASGAQAQRGRWSETQPNGEGVASGSATLNFTLAN